MSGADEDYYGEHKHIMSYLLHIQAGTNGSSIGVCRIGDATSETLLRTAHLPCLVNSEASFRCWAQTKTVMVHTSIS